MAASDELSIPHASLAVATIVKFTAAFPSLPSSIVGLPHCTSGAVASSTVTVVWHVWLLPEGSYTAIVTVIGVPTLLQSTLLLAGSTMVGPLAMPHTSLYTGERSLVLNDPAPLASSVTV